MSLRENQADAKQEEKQMSKHTLLEIKDLHVNVEDKEILDGVDLSIGSDETHVLMAKPAGYILSRLSALVSYLSGKTYRSLVSI